MRTDSMGGVTLNDFTRALEEAARQQGFVLVDSSELPPFDNDNDNDEGFDEVFDGPTEDILDRIIAEAMLEADEELAAQIDRAHKREAVAQLGRIIEGISILASVQADLVKALVLED
ncbi:hypothetical protein [Bradyrhizobium elkanii]|uniref:Uncharacterized protein n=1 Tax=Bradyrhizobium elkanii TaxID=29448 RepID=A0ABV4EZW5_BRAEL|nr:hypothetical protein [Bradyrhizobium elkanii]MCP1757742.1 hypothetical protein [Bradyrhizobium elkanii]MCS3881961.1 hypothetical protein [Bradyrhizobium elkanii]MCS4218721.1 hypothetical protein [Bradyrhizobium elkanii]MCW2109971.1 hypothetical protein [Bradyrhizobium elkanii]MCW2201656.1 hypothetical protein [Bradyrhizobium elkanii]